MKRLVITNTVYGFTYTQLFLTQFLKSFLDSSNIDAIQDGAEFVIFTDEESKAMMFNDKMPGSENIYLLLDAMKGNVRFEKILWSDKSTDAIKYKTRYARLSECLSRSIKIALNEDAWLIPFCADHVIAQDFISKVTHRMEEGYDSVLVQPIRSAAESIIPVLDSYFRAYPAKQLCSVAYKNLHPLWAFSHWEATQFTKGPYVMLWGSPTGLLVRSFPVTPIIFQPRTHMLDCGVIDLNLPQFCLEPYWATDWDQAPIINIDPLSCHYPPFLNHMSSVEYVKSWAEKHIDKKLYHNLNKEFYYPNEKIADIHPDLLAQSIEVVKAILT